MKFHKRYTLFALTALLLGGASSCKEDYFELNTNPNLIANPPLASLLSTTTQKTAYSAQRVANTTSYFVQYLASPGTAGSTDTYQITDYTGTWDYIYFALADLYDMKRMAQAQGASEYVGAADVMIAYHLNLLANTFGAAPFSNAFDGSTLTPTYDSEETLYTTALNLLNEGMTELAKTDSRLKLVAANDLIHKGSTAAWIKTANALKARMLNKVSKKSSYSPAAVLDAVSKSYTANTDDAQMSSFLLRNPWAQVARNNAALVLDGWLSSQFVNQLNGTTYGVTDPRIEKITDKTVTGTYVGTRNGQGNVGGNNTVKDEVYISLNSPLTGDSSPLLIVTYAEMKFVEAEAAFRAGDQARAYTAYLAGIRANMDKLGVAAAARDAYLANPVVAVGASALTLDLIFKEKYVVTYLNPEAWNDARRYDYKYKGFTLPLNAALSTFIRRVGYPNGETSKNGANVPTEVPLSTPLWWDKP
ncbi:SusD/RagB family nutrient-binding outer membrane lipoprotein [Spirosoma sp. KUDC1026]|uniref:SusD/RagB family nutrient-binding outer membrane lipoprotein n=1 Tax=Spirosoma sp. KUDC1026 TaxID=2745947 RepID=UPI00159BB3D7|nr:SusD/RagB family nutrient-binding outer membrane lipoprotein [Spirosoma sp. KUDC1026]QKZ13197.1 SusD/RagB family nutrient-binding outer membrane lipoprotein [Spirosoma sp. KUDC1026]